MKKDSFGNFVGVVKTRKEQQCYFCPAIIPKGSTCAVTKIFPGSCTAKFCDIFKPLRSYHCNKCAPNAVKIPE